MYIVNVTITGVKNFDHIVCFNAALAITSFYKYPFLLTIGDRYKSDACLLKTRVLPAYANGRALHAAP